MKVGIVGCGLITSHKYIPGLKKTDARVDSVCDLNEELARTIAKKNGIPKFYTDFNKMLDENTFDLICICTPPGTHAKLGLRALKSNAHVLIEKPMALTTTECDELIEEARRSARKICVGHSDLFYPPIMEARELIAKGYIGEFRGMRVFLSTPLDYALSKKNHWIHKLPGGVLGETGPHAVYLTNAFVKNINEAKIMTKKNPGYEWASYDDIRIELKGENGISSIVITHSTNQWDAKVDIFGSNKNLYIDMHEFLIQEHNRKNLNIFSVCREGLFRNLGAIFAIKRNILLKVFNRISYGHEFLIKKFVESIQSNTPSPVPPESGKETVRIMEMLINYVRGQVL